MKVYLSELALLKGKESISVEEITIWNEGPRGTCDASSNKYTVIIFPTFGDETPTVHSHLTYSHMRDYVTEADLAY